MRSFYVSALFLVYCYCFIEILISCTINCKLEYYHRPQRSWGKVMFLQASVILLTGGSLPQCMLGYHTSPPPGSRHPPTADPLPAQSMLGDTVNARAVCILLECKLVLHRKSGVRSLAARMFKYTES